MGGGALFHAIKILKAAFLSSTVRKYKLHKAYHQGGLAQKNVSAFTKKPPGATPDNNDDETNPFKLSWLSGSLTQVLKYFV